MAKKKNTTEVQFKADISDFNKGINSAKKTISVLNSELKLNAQALEKDANNAELLAKRTELLKKKQQEQQKVLDLQNKKLERAAEFYEENADELKDYQKQVNQAKLTLGKYTDQVEDSTKKVEDSTEETKQAEKRLKEFGEEAKTSAKKLDKLTDAANKVKNAASKMGSALKSAASVSVAGVSAAAGAGVAGASGLLSLGDNGSDYSRDLARFESNAEQTGKDIDLMKSHLADLVALTGETDSSMEALNNIMRTPIDGTLLSEGVRQMEGLSIAFADTLKIEGIADSFQEMVNAGTFTGSLAEGLERLGYNAETLTEILPTMTKEQRASYLIGLLQQANMGELTDSFKEENAALLEAEKAAFRYEDAMAAAGEATSPFRAAVKNAGADIVNELVNPLSEVSSGLAAMWSGDTGGIDAFMKGVGGIGSTIKSHAGSLAPMGLEIGKAIGRSIVTGITVTLPNFIKDTITALPGMITPVAQKIPELFGSALTAASQLSITSWLPGMLPQVTTFVSTLFATALEVVPQLFETAVTFAGQTLTRIVDFIPQALNAVVDFIPTLVGFIPAILSAIAPQITLLFDGLAGMIPQVLPVLIPALISAAVALVQSVTAALPEIMQVIVAIVPDLLASVVGALTASAPMLIAGAFDLITSLTRELPNLALTLIGMIPEVMGMVVTAIVNCGPMLFEGAVNCFGHIVKGFVEVAYSLASAVVELFSGIGSFIGGVFNVIDGGVSVNTPSTQFFASGGIVNGSTLIGFNGLHPMVAGEKEPEAITPLSALQGMLDTAVSAAVSAVDNSDLIEAIRELADREVGLYVDSQRLAAATASANDTASANRYNLKNRGLAQR